MPEISESFDDESLITWVKVAEEHFNSYIEKKVIARFDNGLVLMTTSEWPIEDKGRVVFYLNDKCIGYASLVRNTDVSVIVQMIGLLPGFEGRGFGGTFYKFMLSQCDVISDYDHTEYSKGNYHSLIFKHGYRAALLDIDRTFIHDIKTGDEFEKAYAIGGRRLKLCKKEYT